jgi:type I restriction enzyme S subunit
MRTGEIRAADLKKDGYRLTGSFYLSEDELALRLLRRLEKTADPMSTLSSGRGIFRGPIFKRQYVDDPARGLPYVSANDLDRVFIEPAGFLSKRLGSLLSDLTLREGMILVTCSGMSLGKALWTRRDMDGLVASHDLIRIEVDSEKIPPGYLYAFLSSRFGRVAIRRQTYGGSVKHIEPQHLFGLRVPRLAPALEKTIHELALRSSTKVSRHVELMRGATEELLRGISVTEPSGYGWGNDNSRLGWSEKGVQSLSLRAMNFDPRAMALRTAIASSKTSPLGSLCVPEWFKGKTIFTRIDAEPEFGALLLGQRKAFRPRPEGRWISRKSIAGLGLQVPPGTTLIPSHGTLGENELYCRALYVTSRMSTCAFSGDFFRCIPVQGAIDAGYLHAFLRSEFAFRLLRSISTGGKQQEQHPVLMWNLPIPRLHAKEEARIGKIVDGAAAELDAAMAAEDEAQTLLDAAISRNS